jgi:hypothetical protein
LSVTFVAVIKLEGGTDLDLTLLEEPEAEEGSRSRTTSESQPAEKPYVSTFENKTKKSVKCPISKSNRSREKIGRVDRELAKWLRDRANGAAT